MTPLDFADYLLESQKRSHSEFNSGTTWGQISLLLQTNEDLEEYIQSRTGMRTTKLYEVRLQLHQAKELAGMNKPDSFTVQYLFSNQTQLKITRPYLLTTILALEFVRVRFSK